MGRREEEGEGGGEGEATQGKARNRAPLTVDRNSLKTLNKAQSCQSNAQAEAAGDMVQAATKRNGGKGKQGRCKGHGKVSALPGPLLRSCGGTAAAERPLVKA
jgi:hypothetical protein